ncbi:MarR family winged helix-turn-helix transcriptional regulator [Basilea psittacipulmonis]|uniref:HTH marR-type domain-containing protein n=1 Tax=Basilea psittacipulmonis DSM 24701 TaxID=1072685 RepID=A0A077DCG8_9BURK|nr:MarR family winged helix-turn-helix transcriptional regulator [Basilea psittacipulmonis]AIL32585.1 hypothetical protein IX83_04010 [Basilea psittacipulmonis DSM 24701]
MQQLDKLAQYLGEIETAMNLMVKNLGFHYNHYAVLYCLASSKDNQVTQKQISEEWSLPKQTVFNICQDYKQKGWILFQESPKDKREKILQLTDLGNQQAMPVLYATQAVSQQVFQRFGSQKTQQLFALLQEFSESYTQVLSQIEHKNN